MNYTNNKPIYIQIAHDIVLKIVNEKIPLASLLPSVRELSVLYTVTPKTIQAVTKYLSENQIIVKKASVGSVVTNDYMIVKNLHHKHGVEYAKEYILSMEKLSYSHNEIREYLHKCLEGDDTDDNNE